MRTLIVRYTPRTGSNTAKLLEQVKSSISGDIEELDVAKELPALFDTQRVDAYGQRNYGGQTLSAADTSAMSQMDQFAAQLKRADVVVLAFPMYNFGLPAAVKAWFDAVMQKGETWTIGKNGYEGLMQGKKALVLMTSGGTYKDEPGSWDTAAPLTRIEFSFMGFSEIEFASAQGMNNAAEQNQRINAAAEKAREILQRWNIAKPELAKAA